MHISDTILPTTVWLGGYGVTGVCTAVVASRIREEELTRTAVLTSLFFATSSIAIPLPWGSAHLMLTGLLGIVLGWKAFPATLTALLLQLLMFGYGGALTLGINTFTMASGSVVAYYVFRSRRVLRPSVARDAAAGALAGALGVLTAAAVYFAALLSGGDHLQDAARFAFLVHLPVVAVEAVITAYAVVFLRKVQPELLDHRRS